MFTALEKHEQQDAYEKLRLQCQKRFSEVDSELSYTFFYGCKKCEDVIDYGFSIFNGPKTFGICLEGYDYSPDAQKMRMVLKFATYSYGSGIGRTAAILAANSNGRVALFHSGRVYVADGRGTPSMPRTTLIEGKIYFFVSYLNDVKLISRLVAFHQSRISHFPPTVVTVEPKQKEAFDLGSEKGGKRCEVIFEAKHHPLASALSMQLKMLGWKISKTSSISPDLIVEKNGSKILFEVKPSGYSHDLMMGLSQLLIYNRFINADRLCLVAAEPPKNALASAIRDHMLENNVDFLRYVADGKSFRFYDLRSLLG